MRIYLAVFVLFAAALCRGDGTPCATGFRAPPSRLRAVPTSTRTKAGDSQLPSSWDSRSEGWLSPVKNQGSVGCCWAFAALATLETQLLKSGRGEWDFSEKNMASMHGYEWGPDDGGNNDIAAGYLTRWGGAVAELSDPYKTALAQWSAAPSVPMPSAIRVKDVVLVPARQGTSDNDTLKQAIRDYGAVATSLLWDFADANTLGANYYFVKSTNSGETLQPNHAVTAVGWDDSYPASSFKTVPPGPGAWIIKNSWGSGRGSGGYYYVSYYDEYFASEDGAVFVPADDGDDLTAAYGYDIGGTGYMYSDSSSSAMPFAAAAFTSAWNEELAAVGVYSLSESLPYTVSVWTNVTRGASTPTQGGALAHTQSGVIEHLGFSTIALETAVPLPDRTGFAVVFEQRTTYPSHKVCYAYSGYMDTTSEPGRTYFGRKSTVRQGPTTRTVTNWTDAVNYCNDATASICMKAYTRSSAYAPTEDTPELAADGTAFLSWLSEDESAQRADSFGAAANIVGANGRSLWASWLAGFDPSVPGDNKLVAVISATRTGVELGWTPDLRDERNYTVFGCDRLGESWRVVSTNELSTSSARFFKVSVGPRL